MTRIPAIEDFETLHRVRQRYTPGDWAIYEKVKEELKQYPEDQPQAKGE